MTFSHIARGILVFELLTVACLYLYSTGKMVGAFRLHRHPTPGQKLIAIGRVLRYFAVIFFCMASIEANLELWNKPLTPRTVFVQAAVICAMVGWSLVDKTFSDEQIFNYRKYTTPSSDLPKRRT